MTTRKRIGGDAPRVVKTRASAPKKKEKTQEPAAAESVADKEPAATQAALRSIGLHDQKKTTARRNKGAETATLGAQLMSFARAQVKKAVGALVLGVSLLSAVQTASADVIHVGRGSATEQAAQRIAQRINEPYVQVNADKAALEQVMQRAQNGEIKMTHLILRFEEGKLPSTWEWEQLKQKYPQAFQQVKRVHVIGYNLQAHPFQAWQGAVFPNAQAIVSLDPSTAVERGPASAFVVDESSKIVEGMPAGLSPQEALLRAKSIAAQGADAGVRTRVDIGDQSHVQSPQNAMSAWLETRGQQQQPITRGELEAKLKEFAASEPGLNDGMLGVLAWQMKQPGFKVDYDAARLASHLLDIRRAGGAAQAMQALQAGNVAQVRHQLAIDQNTTQYAQERSPIFSDQIHRGLPLQGDAAIASGGIQGAPYLVDGLGVVRNGEVNIQAIRHPKNGDGYQLTFKLGNAAGQKLETFMAAQPGAQLIDKTIVNQAPQDGRVVTADKSDAVQASGSIENQQPEMSIGPALRVEQPGKYRIDYFPESISKQSLRAEVQLQVYGESDAARNANLRAALADMGLADAFAAAPSAETEQKLMALRLLEQADPRAHHAMMQRIERGEQVSVTQLHDALVAAEVPPMFLQQAYFAEAAPGHLSVIVPGQSEAYARRGVRGVYHTVGNAEIFAFIAADGALMSTKDRLQVGKVFRGMSSDTDLRTGGADFVFTRQITAGMGNPSMWEMRGGAIIMKSDVLDRADWFAYSGDRYGTTLAGDRGAPTEAVKLVAKRHYDALKARNDASVQNLVFDDWLQQLIRSQTDSREDQYLTRPVGRHQVNETTGTTNETMLEGTIPISQIERFVVRTQEDHEKTVKKLRELGVQEINGVKVEDFVQVRAEKLFTDDEMKSFEAQPTDAQQDPDLLDKRLQFYVRNNVVPNAAKTTIV